MQLGKLLFYQRLVFANFDCLCLADECSSRLISNQQKPHNIPLYYTYLIVNGMHGDLALADVDKQDLDHWLCLVLYNAELFLYETVLAKVARMQALYFALRT